MANYKGHLSGAVVVCFIFVVLVLFMSIEWLANTGGILNSWQMVAGLFIVAMLFGLWPDIDTNSKAQDIFFAIAFTLDIFLIIFGYLEAAAYLGLLAMTPILAKHRGWTHKKWAMFIIPLPILLIAYFYQADSYLVGVMFYLSAVIGYFSHLLLDGLIVKRFLIKNG